ncbi:MAG: hypothetical protein J6R40_06290, partial [Clostridia bacterium]|nr:hypothetical protein [Clostridia bacterium]
MKRLLFAFMLAALCAALCACTPKPTTTMPPTSCPPSLHAFHSCDATGAVSLTKVTTVTFGEELLAKDETTFDFTAGTYTQKTTLRNEAG